MNHRRFTSIWVHFSLCLVWRIPTERFGHVTFARINDRHTVHGIVGKIQPKQANDLMSLSDIYSRTAVCLCMAIRHEGTMGDISANRRTQRMDSIRCSMTTMYGVQCALHASCKNEHEHPMNYETNQMCVCREIMLYTVEFSYSLSIYIRYTMIYFPCEEHCNKFMRVVLAISNICVYAACMVQHNVVCHVIRTRRIFRCCRTMICINICADVWLTTHTHTYTRDINICPSPIRCILYALPVSHSDMPCYSRMKNNYNSLSYQYWSVSAILRPHFSNFPIRICIFQ